MRIIFFYQYFGTPKGGWSTRVYEMTKRWVSQGHHVTVITSPYDKSDLPTGKGLTSKYTYEGIDVIAVNLPQSNKHSKLRRIYTFVMFSIVATFIGLSKRSDVVIASSGPITIGVPGLLVSFFKRKKFVFEVRDLWPDGAVEAGLLKNTFLKKVCYYFEGLFYRNADLVVPCSPGMEASINARYPEVRTLSIPNASDTALFTNPVDFTLPAYAAGKNVFVYTGSLGLMDDCMQLVKAAHEVQKRGWDDVLFVIIGEGAERGELETYVANHDLQNIMFLGLMKKLEVIGWLQHARAAFVVFKDLKVFQTVSPNKMFDAFATGIPIIQSTQGWIKDLLEECPAGITVSPHSPAEFADAIREMIDNTARYEQMKDESANLARNRFDRDILSNKYIMAMEGLLK